MEHPVWRFGTVRKYNTVRLKFCKEVRYALFVKLLIASELSFPLFKIWVALKKVVLDRRFRPALFINLRWNKEKLKCSGINRG